MLVGLKGRLPIEFEGEIYRLQRFVEGVELEDEIAVLQEHMS